MTTETIDKAVAQARHYSRPIAIWLLICAIMIFAMALIGAITRLTESGLSMVEWRPLIGALPPLNESEWQRVFDLYRETPEYIHKNSGMVLDEFKTIFFWEWFHRLWGRLIGFAYALPLFYFLIRRQIPKTKVLPLLAILALGGLQGGVGWFMVKSGLIEQPSVSHYRLALHLGMAFVLFGAIVWQWLDFSHKSNLKIMEQPSKLPYRLSLISLIAVSLTVIWGVFVAGLDAGMIYNEFPFMGDGFVPSEAWYHDPWWTNIVENPATVQFVHRLLATGTVILLVFLWARATHRSQPPKIRQIGWALFAITVLQFSLGVITVVSQLWIPAATVHQGGALLLIATLLWLIYEQKRYLLTEH